MPITRKRVYDAKTPKGRIEERVVADKPLALAQTADSSIFDQFGPPVEVVHPVAIMVAGVETTFHIKQHSITGAAIIETKRYRFENGRLVRDIAYEGVNGLVWELHHSVVQNTGTDEAPVWEPLLPSEAWQAKLNDPRNDVKELINNLSLQVWRFNDELRPSKKKAALMAMGF